MLLTEDPQLGNIGTPLGTVTFVQIIGVCQDELRAAQQWNGPGVIDLLKSVNAASGPWLVTDMRRGESIFDLDPELREAVDDGIAAEGSNLSGASARISWSEDTSDFFGDEKKSKEAVALKKLENDQQVHVTIEDMEDNRTTLSPTLSQRNLSRSSRMSTNQENVDRGSRMSTHAVELPTVPTCDPAELITTKFPPSVHITINHEAGNILPLALRLVILGSCDFSFLIVRCQSI